MLLFYRFLTTFGLPIIFIWAIFRKINGKISDRFFERFGICERKISSNCLWIHAVSVGEVRVAFGIAYKILSTTNFDILMTTTTATSAEITKQEFGGNSRVQHAYLPFDEFFAMRRFVREFMPSKLILVESEIWPNMLEIARKIGISTSLANCMISEKSCKRWAFFREFSSRIFNNFSTIHCASEDSASALVANFPQISNKITLGKNLKYDLSWLIGRDFLPVKVVSQNSKKIVFASVHAEEFEILKPAIFELFDAGFEVVIVPRHPTKENLQNLQKILENRGKFDSDLSEFQTPNSLRNNCLHGNLIGNFLESIFPKSTEFSRKLDENFPEKPTVKFANTENLARMAKEATKIPVNTGESAILIVTKIGVLMSYYGICDLAIICGSFSANLKGHNPLEAAFFGKKIISGEHIKSFQEVYEDLVKN